ncbi:hypothetical protein ACROYT_G039058 [Oculina patagonica]
MDEADPLYSSYIANCVFNSFSSYIAIMLNIVTIHAIRKTPSLPKPLKTLLLSLAVSDLGVGLLVQPLYLAKVAMQLQQNTKSNTFFFVLNVYVFGAYIFVNASFLSVVAISVDRFLAIHLHLRYQELVTHKRVVAVVISIWVLSVFFPIILFWISANIANVVITVVLGFCFICTTIIYCNIYFTVRRNTIQIQALQVQQVEENGNERRGRSVPFRLPAGYKMNEADPLYSSYMANCVINAFSSYTAITLNIVTIHAIRKTSSLPKTLKTLLLSRAVPDLGVGLLVQPLYIVLMVNPTDQSIVTSYDIFTLIFVHASLFTVVAISVDRFLAIHLHLRYQELVTHKRVVAVVI